MNSSKKRKIGRPNQLSRGEILEAALVLLEEQHGKDISMRKLADRLDVTPPTIYGYFKDKNALMQAMADRCFLGLTAAIDFSADWETVIVEWLNHLRNCFKQDPSRIMLAGLMSTSSQGLEELDKVASVIHRVIDDEKIAVLQAQSLLWTVLSFVVFEIRATEPDIVEQLTQRIETDSESLAGKHLAIGNYDTMWELTVKRNIAGLKFFDAK